MDKQNVTITIFENISVFYNNKYFIKAEEHHPGIGRKNDMQCSIKLDKSPHHIIGPIKYIWASNIFPTNMFCSSLRFLFWFPSLSNNKESVCFKCKSNEPMTFRTVARTNKILRRLFQEQRLWKVPSRCHLGFL